MVGSCGKTENRNRYRDILKNRYRNRYRLLKKTDQKTENRYRLTKPIPTQLYCKLQRRRAIYAECVTQPISRFRGHDVDRKMDGFPQNSARFCCFPVYLGPRSFHAAAPVILEQSPDNLASPSVSEGQFWRCLTPPHIFQRACNLGL